MDDNWKQITEFVEKYNDTLVLSFDKVYVLRGCVDIPNDDYCWILQNLKGEFSEHSCVMSVIPLKEYLPIEDYNRLVSFFQLNLNRLSQEVK